MGLHHLKELPLRGVHGAVAVFGPLQVQAVGGRGGVGERRGGVREAEPGLGLLSQRSQRSHRLFEEQVFEHQPHGGCLQLVNITLRKGAALEERNHREQLKERPLSLPPSCQHAGETKP